MEGLLSVNFKLGRPILQTPLRRGFLLALVQANSTGLARAHKLLTWGRLLVAVVSSCRRRTFLRRRLPSLERAMTKKFLKVLSISSTLLERIGFIWLWAFLSIALLLPVAMFNWLLIPSYFWAASKVMMAGTVGYGLDWAAFRGADPRYLDGIEKSMAQSRRGVLIAAAMIAAGLIG